MKGEIFYLWGRAGNNGGTWEPYFPEKIWSCRKFFLCFEIFTKQARAELCQAQGKLNLFWPRLDPCLPWLTNMVLICHFGLWISQNLSPICSVWKGFIPRGSLQVQKNIGFYKKFGSKRNFGSTKILGLKPLCAYWKNFVRKKFWSEKNLGKKKMWPQKVVVPKIL